jgi:hypothetical protein
MEERRTAAWVLGILALIIIFFTIILPKIKHSGRQTLAFKNCVVHFKYNIPGGDADIYRANQNRLALCLCDSYQKNSGTATRYKIIEIYKDYDRYNHYDSTIVNSHYSIDSIIKHKSAVFDTVVVVED